MPPGNTKVVGRRSFAMIFDAIVATAVGFGVFFAFAEKRPAGTTAFGNVYARVRSGADEWVITGGKAGVFFLVLLVFTLAYWVVAPAVTGATLGQGLLGIRVVSDDGRRAGFGRNLVRQLLWIVDDFPYFIPWLTGFVVALSNPQNKRVGDMVAGTWVVRSGSQVAAAPSGLAVPGVMASGLPDPTSVPVGIPGSAPSAGSG